MTRRSTRSTSRLGAQIAAAWREREALVRTYGLSGQALRARLITLGVLRPKPDGRPTPAARSPRGGGG